MTSYTESCNLAKLSDGKLRVCRGDRELCILPAREACTLDDLMKAFNIVVEDVVKEFENSPEENQEWW
jgi:hypothetical protein